jgi:hypothetical protein
MENKTFFERNKNVILTIATTLIIPAGTFLWNTAVDLGYKNAKIELNEAHNKTVVDLLSTELMLDECERTRAKDVQ